MISCRIRSRARTYKDMLTTAADETTVRNSHTPNAPPSFIGTSCPANSAVYQ